MHTEELNKHIKNYLENDKTNSAIMLTGAWGSGKSYYVKNELTPYLWECGKHKCAAVSLYGITSLSDLSKAIFWELQFSKKAYLKKQKSKPENDKVKKTWFLRICKKGKSLGWLAVGFGKTLLKGLAKTKDIDLDINEKDLERVYKSVDTNGTLVILEDLERSSIDIIEVLGFVNNLVEQDGVKVLLVSNEEELIERKIPEVKDKKEKDIQNLINDYTDVEYLYTKKTEEYLRKKEKTVSDTLKFENDKKRALKGILNQFFSQEEYSSFMEEEYISEIVNVMDTVKSDNLRSVMFACQKTSDMFALYNKTLNEDFKRFVLCSIIAFSCRLKNGEDCQWENNESSPMELGTAGFPLYKVCYDYINKQRFIKVLLEQAEQIYLKRKELENNKNEFNSCFHILHCFYNDTEQNISQAIIQIKRLLKENKVEYAEYGMLANYLIAVRDCVDNCADIDECKRLMLDNIQNCKADSYVEQNITYHSGIELEEVEQRKELEEFKKEVIEILHRKEIAIFDLTVSKNNIQEFIDNIEKNRSAYLNSGSFMNNIKIAEFIEVLKQCSSRLLGNMRGAFLSIYSSVNIKEFLGQDKDSLESLKNELKKLQDEYDGFDKIQKKQLKWFINNLEGIIDKLS